MSSGVYVIHGKGTGRYKIGCTINMKERLKGLQNGSPVDIEIISIHYTSEHYLLEKMLHQRFAHVRLYGEWFGLGAEDVLYLSQETNRIVDDLGHAPLEQEAPERNGDACPRCGDDTSTIDPDIVPVVRERLALEYRRLGGYKPVAAPYGVSASLVWQILTRGYVPKTYEMLKKLGYIPTCPRCGYEFDEA